LKIGGLRVIFDAKIGVYLAIPQILPLSGRFLMSVRGVVWTQSRAASESDDRVVNAWR